MPRIAQPAGKNGDRSTKVLSRQKKKPSTTKAKDHSIAQASPKKTLSVRAQADSALQKERVAKQAAIAKAKAIAPHVTARIGSTPATKFRGNPDVFGRLVEDHDRHRALLAMVSETKAQSADRKKLFKELTLELKSHAAAEEQALWSSVMRHPQTTDEARHAVSEHKEIDEMLADLAARDMASPAWMRRFSILRDEYLHHIAEEEQEQFVAAERVLSPADLRHMKKVFQQRKKAEKANTTIEKKIKIKS